MTKLIGQLRLLLIFDAKSGDACELAHVTRDERRLVRDCRGGDQLIERAYLLPVRFKLRTDA